jgi:hypothetical protein
MKAIAGSLALLLGMAATLALAATGMERREPYTMLSWDAGMDGSPRSYAVGGVRLTFLRMNERPALYVRLGSGVETVVLGEESSPSLPVNAEFGVGRLDAASATPQVIFATYSGGAHCCTSVDVLSLDNGAWKTIRLGTFDAGAMFNGFPKDIDGDGVRDFVVRDDRFAYAFTDYADSVLPPRILHIADGAVADVSADARYALVYRRALNRAREGCRARNNGACAAYVAAAARLGRYEAAWAFMLAHYDKDRRWFYPAKCNVARVDGDCPKGQETEFDAFPDALAWFLEDIGYVKKN